MHPIAGPGFSAIVSVDHELQWQSQSPGALSHQHVKRPWDCQTSSWPWQYDRRGQRLMSGLRLEKQQAGECSKLPGLPSTAQSYDYIGPNSGRQAAQSVEPSLKRLAEWFVVAMATRKLHVRAHFCIRPGGWHSTSTCMPTDVRRSHALNMQEEQQGAADVQELQLP